MIDTDLPRSFDFMENFPVLHDLVIRIRIAPETIFTAAEFTVFSIKTPRGRRPGGDEP